MGATRTGVSGKTEPTHNCEVSIITFKAKILDPPFLGIARGPAQVAKLVRPLIPQDGREHFWLLFLNSNLDVLGCHELAIGTLTGAFVSPREIYGAACKVLGTASVILVHNHPSGNPTPSRQDVEITKKIAKAGKILDIPLHDHVILWEPGHCSLAEKGVFQGAEAD